MQQKEFETLQNQMKEKLGDENFAKISSDMATLMTDNNSMNTQISNKDTEISQLKQVKTDLLETNGNLMQKITMGFDETINNPPNPNKQEKAKPNIKEAFDEKGRFI